jgi:hypothetical protein
LDSASLNYPGTDTLVLVIELAEICVDCKKIIDLKILIELEELD